MVRPVQISTMPDRRGVVDAQPRGAGSTGAALEDERVGRSPPASPGRPACSGPSARARSAGDGVGEAGVDADVAPLDRRVGDEIDLRPVDEGVAVRAGEARGRHRRAPWRASAPCRRTRRGRPGAGGRRNGSGPACGRTRPAARPPSPARSDAAVGRAASGSGRDEPTGARRGVRRTARWRSAAAWSVAESSRGPAHVPRWAPGPSPPDPVPPWGERWDPCAILSLRSGGRPPRRSPRDTGEPDARDLDRVVLRTVWLSLYVRIRRAQAAAYAA